MIILFAIIIFTDFFIVHSILGLNELLLIPAFLALLLLAEVNIKKVISGGLVFSLLTEVIYGLGLGAIMIPFMVMVGLYYWLGRFLSVGSFSEPSSAWSNIIKRSVMILLLIYLFSFLFILNDSHNIKITSERWLLLGGYHSILLNYVLAIILARMLKYIK